MRRRRVRATTAVLVSAVSIVAIVSVLALAGCSGSSEDNSAPTRSQIATLLAHHGAAVRDHDRAAFLADVASGDAAKPYRTRARQVFTNLGRLPLSGWSYSLGPRATDAAATTRAREAYGTATTIMRVSLSYGLRGVDARPTSHDLYLTFTRQNGRVVIADDRALDAVGGASWRGPWDFGSLRVTSGRTSLVLAHDADADLAGALVAATDRAVPTVNRVVGSRLSRVAVLVAGSAAERSAELGPAAANSAETAAVATSDGTDPVSGAPLGQRVVVVADEYGRLTTAGARLVLQHEITHVATARQTTDSTPTWLTEGFADYVGYLGNERPVSSAAAELAAQVRRSGPPRALPDSEAFASATSGAAAYELSWLACRRIAAQHGQAALVRFYDAVGASREQPDDAVAAAARSVLGETTAQLLARTRSYVAEQLR